jgi:hypothetical protein
VNAPNFSVAFGADLTVGEDFNYAGAFTQDSGSLTAITTGNMLSLTGAASLSGETSGAGALELAGANDSLTGAVIDGSNVLYTEGTTAASGLTIGGTVEWENTNTVNQSGGDITLGGKKSADAATLFNTSGATYDILDDSGIGIGASTASDINNVGLLEKTLGTGTSAIAPAVTNTGTIEVAAGTLNLQGAVAGTGSDIIAGAATLGFAGTVAAGQTASFTGNGGELGLHYPAEFAGQISGFDTTGAGSNDTIDVGGPWVFSGFTENAGGTEGTLAFANGARTMSLTLVGDYNPADFVHQTQPNGTLITYT